MMNLAEICVASKQTGNALIILLLIQTWEGEEPPTRDKLAALARVTIRQAERHLIKLIADGEIGKSSERGRGVKTHYHPVYRTYPSDKNKAETSDQAAETEQSLSDTNVRLSGAKSEGNDISTTSDVRLNADKSDVDVVSNSGTEVAPLMPKKIKKILNTQPTVEADAHAPPKSRKSKPQTPAEPDPRKDHEAIKLVRRLMSRFPDKIFWDDFIEILGEEPDVGRLTACRKDWVARGWNNNSVDWVYWYRDGIPERNSNGQATNNGRAAYGGRQSPTRDLSIFPERRAS